MDLHLHQAKIYPLLVLLARRLFIFALAVFVLLLIGWPLIQKWMTFFSTDTAQDTNATLSVLENVMETPKFVSKTHQGDPYEVEALRAKGTLEGTVSLQHPKAKLRKGDKILVLKANRGQFQEKKGVLSLQKHVELQEATGYHLKTEQAYMNLKTNQLEGHKPVRASGPVGSAQAGGFTFKQSGKNNVLILKNNPRLVIYPSAKPL